MCIKRSLYIALTLLTTPCMAVAGMDDLRPNEHFCPITQQVMKNPVVWGDGHSYEQEELEQWIKTCVADNRPVTSPKTRQVINSTFYPNFALRTAIQEWPPTFSQDVVIASIGRMYAHNQELVVQNQSLQAEIETLKKAAIEFQEQFERTIQDKDRQNQRVTQEKDEMIKDLQMQLAEWAASQNNTGRAQLPASPKSDAAVSSPQSSPPAPLAKQVSTAYPAAVRGFEDVYDQFMNAKLIYTHPQTKKTTEWVFGSIMPQLFQGGRTSVPFDLSGCDADTQKYVNINIGFRTKKGGHQGESMNYAPLLVGCP